MCLLAAAAALGQPTIGEVLSAVEKRYNHLRTLEVSFEQIYWAPGRPPRAERGIAYFRKPRLMRWEYHEPAGKLFVSDGSSVWFYSPLSRRVEKMPLRASGDWRAPLAVLMGELDFRRFFREFRGRHQDDAIWIQALPKQETAAYSHVELLVGPDYSIRRLVIHGRDQSRMEFRFAGERLNPAVPMRLFRFQPPPGVEVVEVGVGQEGGEQSRD